MYMYEWVLYLKNEIEVAQPLCVLQGGVPLAAGHGETQQPQGVVALPHRMDVGDGQVLQLGSRVAGDDLWAFTLHVKIVKKKLSPTHYVHWLREWVDINFVMYSATLLECTHNSYTHFRSYDPKYYLDLHNKWIFKYWSWWMYNVYTHFPFCRTSSITARKSCPTFD